MTRLNDRDYAALLNDEKVQQAMRFRCEEERHDFENCMSFTFQVYQQCKWCGARR
jgi:hypothetical protein